MANSKITPRKKVTTNKKTQEYAKPVQFDNTPKVMPIVITIKNKTDEKLYDIPFLDYNDEFSGKVQYSSETNSISYNDILNILKSNGVEFSLIYASVSGDYYKNVAKQLSQTYSYLTKDISGKTLEAPHNVMLDPFQQQSNIAVLRHTEGFKLGIINHCVHNIKMNRLMPEVECTFRIYITETTSKQ